MPRRFAIFQFPNPPLIAAMLAAGVARVSDGTASRAAALASQGALVVWAYREVSDGANWFRRLIGVGGLAYGVAAVGVSVNELRPSAGPLRP